MPVLGEAVAVAREMGVAVRSFHDVGVAGIHRLTRPLEELRSFDPDCLIVAAGMEGALPSVVAGLVAVPVVGLPTSTGYGLGDGTAQPPSWACSDLLARPLRSERGQRHRGRRYRGLVANRAALGRASGQRQRAGSARPEHAGLRRRLPTARSQEALAGAARGLPIAGEVRLTPTANVHLTLEVPW